jgi:hypothetical protein
LLNGTHTVDAMVNRLERDAIAHANDSSKEPRLLVKKKEIIAWLSIVATIIPLSMMMI